jgi:NAD+ kinase
VAAEELEQALDLLVQRRYQIENRGVVTAQVNQGNQQHTYHALNDVVLGWGGSSRIVTLRLLVDEEEVGLFACDGMILSTPTGSTGHALSNGGPILHPQLPCMGITFICPHTLSSRPLVIPSESRVRIEIVRSVKSILLSVDGHDQAQLNEGDCVEISAEKKSVSFIRLADHSYFSTLTQKLNWHGNLL